MQKKIRLISAFRFTGDAFKPWALRLCAFLFCFLFLSPAFAQNQVPIGALGDVERKLTDAERAIEAETEKLTRIVTDSDTAKRKLLVLAAQLNRLSGLEASMNQQAESRKAELQWIETRRQSIKDDYLTTYVRHRNLVEIDCPASRQALQRAYQDRAQARFDYYTVHLAQERLVEVEATRRCGFASQSSCQQSLSQDLLSKAIDEASATFLTRESDHLTASNIKAVVRLPDYSDPVYANGQMTMRLRARVRAEPPGDYLALLNQQAKDSMANSSAAQCPRPEPVQAVAPGKPGDSFKDCADCPLMVVIEGGAFQMGARADESRWFIRTGAKPEWADWERPQHSVEIDYNFGLMKTEVSNRLYRLFIRDTGYASGGGCSVYRDKGWAVEPQRSWRNPGHDPDDSLPVACVSWVDANAFIDWLNNKTGLDGPYAYRLPSEAEWEYAARANTATIRFWGDDLQNDQACAYANVADRQYWSLSFDCRDGSRFLAAVGQKDPNSFGLHDMLGNVWEWVADCANSGYRNAPGDGRAWLTGQCQSRVMRGGSWYDAPRVIRSANRTWQKARTRSALVGFRVARTLPR